jgi:HEAT repeat protein
MRSVMIRVRDPAMTRSDRAPQARIPRIPGLPRAEPSAVELKGVVSTLAYLADDPDPLIRVAALEASAALGCLPPLDRCAAAAAWDGSWQVRKAAAVALGVTVPEIAIAPLVVAAQDGHIDVRKAAIRSLARWTALPLVITTLTMALSDCEAEVRACARRALPAWIVHSRTGQL